MEKLEKLKHNHKLTDILKVLVFALIILFPFIVLTPTLCYYGNNKYATAQTKTTYEQTVLNFNQRVYAPTNEIIISANTSERNIVSSNNISNVNDIYLCKYYQSTTLTSNVRNTVYIVYGANENLYEYVGENNSLSSGFHYWRFTAPTTDFTLGLWTVSLSADNVYYYFNLYNLTQIYGSGNEPSNADFLTQFSDDFYDYTLSSDVILDEKSNVIEYTMSITDSISYAWEEMWNTNLFSWTNNSPFKTSINGFLSVFQIDQQSGLELYLNYLITMIGIYVVIDIVIELFKWLTHLIGQK